MRAVPVVCLGLLLSSAAVAPTAATGGGADVATGNQSETDAVTASDSGYSPSVAPANDSVSGPETFTVALIEVSDNVVADDTLNVQAHIRNTGDANGTQDVTLSVNGTQVDDATVSLRPGEETTVALSWPTERGDSGDHVLTVDTANDSVSVLQTVRPWRPKEPGITVPLVSAPDTVTAGETLTTTTVVANTGNGKGMETVVLTIDGEWVNSTEVSVDSGRYKVVTLSWHTESDDAGEYGVAVLSDDDTVTTNVTVTDSATTSETREGSADITETETPGTEGSAGENGPGFGVVATLVAVGTLLVVRRRRH